MNFATYMNFIFYRITIQNSAIEASRMSWKKESHNLDTFF